MRLQDELQLRTAGTFGLVRNNQGTLLPLVYGDFFVTSTADELGGTTPAVLVVYDTLTYLINDAPSHPDIPLVYVDGVPQDASTFTYEPRRTDGTGREVATIQFTLDSVLSSQISVRMKGTVKGPPEAPVLMTNPIEALQDAFVNHGNWFATDFDPTTINEARRLCDQLGYTVHWAFTDTKTYKQHLVDLLVNYHGDHVLTANSQLAVLLDVGRHIHEDKVWPALIDIRDMAGVDPTDSIECDDDEQNLVNEITVRYQYSWVTGEYAATQTFTDGQSLSGRGRHARTYDLPGIRSEGHLNTWVRFFFERYSGTVNIPKIVRFTLETLVHLGLTQGVYVALNWAYGPDPLGRGWTGRVLKVLNMAPDVMAQQQVLECFDIGVLAPPENALMMYDQSNTLWYAFAAGEGQLELSDIPPFHTFVLPTPVHWLQQQSPNGTTLFIYPTPERSFEVSDVQPSVGSGVVLKPMLIDHLFRGWHMVVADHRAVVLRPMLTD